jgi:hypothetical protein
MTLTVKHEPVVGPNNPAKQVSKDVYEAPHKFSGLTAGQILYADSTSSLTSNVNLVFSDAVNRLSVGAGGGATQGWVIGNNTPGQGSIWPTEVTPTAANFWVSYANGAAYYQVVSNHVFRAGSGFPDKFTITSGAGVGPSITAGTAATDVNALSITQTWNNAAVTFTGLRFTITDTSSAAGSLALRILGGAAATTDLMALTKSGGLCGVAVRSGGGDFETYNTMANAEAQSVAFRAVALGYNFTGVRIGSNYSYYFSANAGGAGDCNTVDTQISRISAGLVSIGNGTGGSFAGSLKLTDLFTNNAAALVRTNTALTDGAGANTGTLTNAPAAGDPTKWIGIDDNGTTRYVPAW